MINRLRALKQKSRREDGINLVEVLVSIALISILMATTLGVVMTMRSITTDVSTSSLNNDWVRSLKNNLVAQSNNRFAVQRAGDFYLKYNLNDYRLHPDTGMISDNHEDFDNNPSSTTYADLSARQTATGLYLQTRYDIANISGADGGTALLNPDGIVGYKLFEYYDRDGNLLPTPMRGMSATAINKIKVNLIYKDVYSGETKDDTFFIYPNQSSVLR